MGDRLKEYELLFIVSPRVAVDDVPNAIERVSALIQDAGGEVLSVDNWGRRRLAYPIKHYFEGAYVVVTLRLPPTAPAIIDASLIISEEVIRHLLTEGIIPPTNRDRGRPFDRSEDRERPLAAAEQPAVEQPETAEPTHEEPAAGEMQSEESVVEEAAVEAPEAEVPAAAEDEPGSSAVAPEPTPAVAE